MVVYKATWTWQGIFDRPKNLTGLFIHTGSFNIFAFSHGTDHLNVRFYNWSNRPIQGNPDSLGFGTRITSQGIQNPSSTDKDWNPVPRIRNPQR